VPFLTVRRTVTFDVLLAEHGELSIRHDHHVPFCGPLRVERVPKRLLDG
jgi:hypothetical protein